MTDAQGKLDAIIAMVEQAKTKPLSGTVVIPRADLLTALTALRDELPEQLAEARKVLRERRSLVESARTEAERLLSDARRQSERAVDEARRNSERMLASARQERQSLVDSSAVLGEAEDDAEQLIADARAEAARMRAETDDYVDASLARFEALLEHTLATVGRGRDKLRELSDSAQQQEFPDPDGHVGMPVAPPVALGKPLEEIDLGEGGIQATLTGDDETDDETADAALAR
jgi:cell division septum initiation protein DivIVA